MAPRSPSLRSIGGLIVLFATHALAQNEQDQKLLSELESLIEDVANFTDSQTSQPNEPLYPARDALMTTFLELEHPCSSKRGQPTTDFDVPVDTCATANFTLDRNVYLEYTGLCEGGVRSPSVVVYDSANCAGNQRRLPWRSNGMGPGHCMGKAVWGRLASNQLDSLPKEWSIMFHCTDDESITSTTPTMNLSLPLPPPPPAKKPERPRPTFASVSDSACFIRELGMDGHPRFIFQKPPADTCVDVAALHKLKIYRNALCPNGTEALFAKWDKSGCRGEPASVQEVDQSLIATNSPSTCIDMGGEDKTSYAFLCDGGLKSEKVSQSLFEDDDEDAIHLHYSYGSSQSLKVTTNDAMGNRIDGSRNIAALFSWLGLFVLF